MYKFVDTTQVSGSALLPSEALKINGVYIENVIEGYRTLGVSGREALSPELTTYEVGTRDGATLQSKRYPPRYIIVRYQLVCADAAAFREAYNKLADILNVENAKLIFKDESDKYYTGTPSAIGEVEPGRNSVVGEFEIFCADPFKYSNKVYTVEAVTDANGNTSFSCDYNGTYKYYPSLQAEFIDEEDVHNASGTETDHTGAGDCGYVAFFNEDEKIIQLGDAAEVDAEAVPASQTLININFGGAGRFDSLAKNYWKVNEGFTTSSAIQQVGTMGSVYRTDNPTNDYYLSASDYGTGSAWHGATVTRAVKADKAGNAGATHFELTTKLVMAISKTATGVKECGCYQCLVVNDEGASPVIVAGVSISKSKTGSKGTIKLIVSGKTVKTMDVDLSYYNEWFGCYRTGNDDKGIEEMNPIRTLKIVKEGNQIEFEFGDKSYNFKAAKNYKATKMTFSFLQYGTKTPLHRNGITRVKFVKNLCETWRDIPNKFSAGDVVKAYCTTGKIYLNGKTAAKLGALGNDWEDFYLKPGTNHIGVAYSDWLTGSNVPKFTLKYREAYL